MQTETIWRAWIPFTPTPKGRGRNVGNRVVTPTKTRRAEDAIREFADRHFKGAFSEQEPVSFRIVVYRSKPKSKPKKVVFPLSKPDLDNYIKLVSDSLNKIIYSDDSAIVHVEGWKVYGERDGYLLIFERIIEAPEFDLQPWLDPANNVYEF